MNKKLLTAMILSLAVMVPQAKADPSALEQAWNNPEVGQYFLPNGGTEIIQADLTQRMEPSFAINDFDVEPYEHYGSINGNGHSGFSMDNFDGIMAVNMNEIYGFNTPASDSNPEGNGGAFNLTHDSYLEMFSYHHDGITPLMTTIRNNTAAGKGGAIYAQTNWGSTVSLCNVNIQNNTAGAEGGGIYMDYGHGRIDALSGSTVNINNNTAHIGGQEVNNDIYLYTKPQEWVRGSFNLYAHSSTPGSTTEPSGQGRINIGDMRAASYFDVNVLSSDDTDTHGRIDIGKLWLDGTSSFTTKRVSENSQTEINIGTLDMRGASVLDTTNNYIEQNLHVDNLVLTGKNYWNLDTDLATGATDQINANITGGGELVLNFNPITAVDTDVTNLDLGFADNADLTLSAKNFYIGDTKYTVSFNNDNTANITLEQERDGGSLQHAIADSTVGSYNISYLGVQTCYNLGELVNDETGHRTFTINGRYVDDDDHVYYSGVRAVAPNEDSIPPRGIKVTDGETLKLQDVSYFSNFRKKDPNKANGAAIEAYNADIIITNPNNPNKTEFTGNTLTYTSNGGGAIYTEGGVGQISVPTNSLTIDKAVFKNNYSGYEGGAIYARNIKDINITNTDFIGNKGGDGAAIYIRTENNTNDPTTVNIENVTFNGNGGGTIGSGNSDVEIRITDYKKHNSTVNIKDAEFTGRTGGYASSSLRVGGGEYRYNFKSTTLDGINIHDNKNSRGVVATNMGTLTLKNSTIANNTNDSALDPLIYVNNVDRTIIDNTIFDNNRAVLINTEENITIKDSTITNNILNMQHGDTGMIELDYSNLTMNLDNLTVDNNEVYSQDSNYWAMGLFENYGSNSTINFNGGTYTNNKAHGNASIIAGELKSKFVLNDVKFQNNSVENTLGGMIGYAQQDTPDRAQRVDIWINAVDDNVVFSGNSAPNGKANDLYVATSGKTYLNANAGRSINMEDIYVEHRPDAQTWDSKKFPTQLYLNNKGGTGAINIGKITLENGAELFAANGRIDDLRSIENLSLVGQASKLFVDADLRNNTVDKFKNVEGSALNLAFNILDADPDAMGGGSLTLFTGTVDSDLVIADSETVYGNNKYSFSQSAAGSGVIHYSVVKDRALTLQNALEDYETESYDLPALTILTEDLGEMSLEDYDHNPVVREFAINGGEGGLLTSQGHNGIIINGAQDQFGTKLILNEVGTVDESGNPIDNSAVVVGFLNQTDDNHAHGSFVSSTEADLEINNAIFYGNSAVVDVLAANAPEIVFDEDRDNAYLEAVDEGLLTNDALMALHDEAYYTMDEDRATYYNAQGGAIYAVGQTDDENLHTTNITGSDFNSNIASSDVYTASGGAIYSKFNNLNVTDSNFEENSVIAKSTASGGAICFENPYPSTLEKVKLTIKDTNFVGNKAVSQGNSNAMGGALAVIGNEGPSVEVVLENVIFKDNNVTTGSANIDRYGNGGAIYNENGRITLKNVQFMDNTATSSATGETIFSDITNRGVNGVVTFLGGDTTLQGGIVNRKGIFAEGGHVIVDEGANLTFTETSKLEQGSLIINNGTVTINSDYEDNILDRLTVADGSALTLNSPLELTSNENAGNSGNKGIIYNNDSFTIGKNFTSGPFDNKGIIAGAGTITLKTTFNNDGIVTNDMTLDGSSAVLNSKYENMNGNVIFNNSHATYNVLSDRVVFDDPERIQGAQGKLYLHGDIVSDTTLDYTGDVFLADGTVLTLGNNGDAFQGVRRLYVGTGQDDIVNATLNVLNGSQDDMNYYGDNADLYIGSGSRLKLEMDWGDTLKAESLPILGKALISKLDISNTEDGDEYRFATGGCENKIAIEDIDLITAKGKANSVTYDNQIGSNTYGKLMAERTTLANIIRRSDEAANEDAFYNYAMDSDEEGNSARNIIGNLKVQGNGNSITGTGLTVGGTDTTGEEPIPLSGNLILQDANVSGVTTMADGTGAITINPNSSLTVRAENNDVKLSGTKGANKNVIYMDTANENTSTVRFEANNGHTITVSDNIDSNNENNQVFFDNGTVIANGEISNVIANNTGSDTVRGGKDNNVQWRLFDGTLKYTKDSYLNNSEAQNSIEFSGGDLDLRNGGTTTIALADLAINGTDSKLYIDADLKRGTADKLTSDNMELAEGSVLTIAGVNLLSDAKSGKTTINLTDDEDLMEHLAYNGTVTSRIFKYNANYDNQTGNIEFNRFSGGGYKDYNPAVFASPVAAQLGGYLTQLNSYDEAFRNMDMYMLMTSKQRQALKFRNKVASLYGAAYDNLVTPIDRPAGWLRPYATFEKVGLHNGPKVENTAWGSFFGGESSMKELGHGWDGMWGAYVGYNGSHQHYDGISIYQNGGTLGLVGMAYKDNFFVGGTVNVGANAGEASTQFGQDDFGMLMSGVAVKGGYNWEFAEGKFIIQPSLQTSYTFVNTFDYTNAAGVRIDSDPLHAIQIEPGLKFIGNLKNGWQPYAGVSFVYNIIDKTHFRANDVSLPNLSINPYVKYGIGVRKTWGDRITGHLQTFLMNGGRTGIGVQAGFRFAIGKEGGNSISGKTPELKKTQIKLSSMK